MPRNNTRTLNSDTLDILNNWEQQWQDDEQQTATTTMRGKFRHPQRIAAYSGRNVQEQVYELQQVLIDFARVFGVY